MTRFPEKIYPLFIERMEHGPCRYVDLSKLKKFQDLGEQGSVVMKLTQIDDLPSGN